MQLSVIILNYNVRFFLEQCVLSIQKALKNIDGEIIVIDNNSSDDSCAMMKELFPNVKLIENKENLGFPKGNNIGVAQAKGDYICILNPDTVVAEDTFEKILNSKFQIPNSEIGMIGCKLIDGTGNFLPESKRGVPTPWVAFTKIFGLYKISNVFGKYYAQHLTENQSGKVDILVGAFMVMKRELYNEIGGFDENCFMYSDDIDLSYMALKKGKTNYYFHETTVIHYKGESTVRDSKYMKRFQEAMNFFYSKHFKKSFVFDIFMKTGVLFFSFVKLFQGNTINKKSPQIYILVSDSPRSDELLYTLERNLNANVICKSVAETYIDRRVEFIIDLNSISYKKAISLMELNENKNFTFKFLNQKSNYLIGSNNSIDRGEIITLKN